MAVWASGATKLPKKGPSAGPQSGHWALDRGHLAVYEEEEGHSYPVEPVNGFDSKNTTVRQLGGGSISIVTSTSSLHE